MLFGDYIKVRKNKANKWEISEKFKRYHQTDIWEPLFQTLLNIPNCYEMPDLSHFIDLLNEYVKQNINQIVRDANDLEIMSDSALKKRKK
jgi:checkpoint serine/threonine-protein kinase